MEKDIAALEKRLIHESGEMNPALILYAIHDCILDGSIEVENDLLRTSALERISKKLDVYYNREIYPPHLKERFEISIRSSYLIEQLNVSYKSEHIPFDDTAFKENWPRTLEMFTPVMDFFPHMILTRAMILRNEARNKGTSESNE